MKVTISESVLKKYIQESVDKVLNEAMEHMPNVEENTEEEGFIDNLKTGAKTFFSNNPKYQQDSISNRWQRAKANYQAQNKIGNYRMIISQLAELVNAGKLNPEMTIAQLIGGKYNNNRIGRLNSFIGGQQSSINSRK